MTVLLTACGKAVSTTSTGTASTGTASTDISEEDAIDNSEQKLPAGLTIENIKSAFSEYINYRLWLYPAEITGDTSDKAFDNYIGKAIDVEIRLYRNEADTVYAHTDLGDWLAVFKTHNGFVYCDGQASSEDTQYLKENDYDVIEKYSVRIPEPHKPNYGTSENKDKLIAAAESKINSACEEFNKSENGWEDVEVYIADFYEYESGLHAWLCKKDGSIVNYPLAFEENNNEITVQTVKGFSMKSKKELNEFGLFQFERDISDAVKHFKCNE